jgi:hypothetical protein
VTDAPFQTKPVSRRRLSHAPVTRAVVVLVAGIIAVNVLLGAADSIVGGGTPGGPVSSSFATGDDGLAAWATLLRERGVDVRRLRTTLDRADLGGVATVVIADPASIDATEVDAARSFAATGGTVVVSGEPSAPLASAFVPGMAWTGDGPTVATVVEGGAGQARAIRLTGSGWWSATGNARVVAADAEQAVVVTAPVGTGRVVALADSGPLRNELLDEADDAAFALAIAGDGPVAFAEAAHGYGDDGFGLDDLPGGWAGFVVGLALAGAAWMWSIGRRFGPPNDADDELPPPPRRAYVDALAASTVRAGSSEEAVAPLRAHARRRLARRAGVDAAVSDDELRRAAARAGVDPHIVDAVVGGTIMELGRAAARLEER